MQLDRSSFSITMVENVSQWDRECQLTTRNVHSLKVNESVLHSYKLQMKNLIRHSSNLSLSLTHKYNIVEHDAYLCMNVQDEKNVRKKEDEKMFPNNKRYN